MTQHSPTTRLSLVYRLANAQDRDSWTEFVKIYEPLILRLMQRNGLQESDARDVCQQVLQAVAKDVQRWKPDGREASFRRWLFRIARNRVITFVERERKRLRAAGGTSAQLLLEKQADLREPLSDVFEREYRDQLVVWAAKEIRSEFRGSTWEAFWQSCIEGRPIAEVAAELSMSIGSIYVARTRVTARLRVKVEQVRGDE